MRRPVAEVPEQAFLPFAFGAQFKNLLLAKQVDGQGRRNRIGELSIRGFFNVGGKAVEDQGVAGFVVVNQLGPALSVNGGFTVFQVVALAFQTRTFGTECRGARWGADVRWLVHPRS